MSTSCLSQNVTLNIKQLAIMDVQSSNCTSCGNNGKIDMKTPTITMTTRQSTVYNYKIITFRFIQGS